MMFSSDERVVDELSWTASFERRAAEQPDAIAVVCESERLTYRELNASANRLARLLISRGVRREDVVGVALPRSADLVVALLGVMKAGAAYLPLDLDHPEDRIAFMLEDAGARVVIENLDGISSFDDSNVDGPDGIDHAAYVIYTSGSTGKPKGVVVTHEGIGSLMATATDRIGITASSRVVQFASVGFDVTVWDLVMSLCVGGRVILVPAERRVAGEALTGYINEHGATHMILPPSLVAALPENCELPEGAVLVVGTETVPTELIARWNERLKVVAAYGLTEATVNSTLWRAQPGWTGPVPIGVPDPNTRCYVLDSSLRPVPVGEEGELYVAGRGLARGYLGRHALTSERFVADPFGKPGARMYRTGDRARWREDGNLDFLGRADGQIKIRGYRIEPGEIESVLMAHPGIAQAAVVVREDQRRAKRLVAHIVGGDPAAARAWVAATLPEYMVPTAVVVHTSPLPLTPNGKLDRKALPEPDWTALVGDALPVTQAEHVLAGLFADVLNLPSVGVHDSFFELGGDSIVAIGLVSKARQAGFVITPREVFRHRTVSALAAIARSAVAEQRHDDGTGLVPATPILRWLRELGGQADAFYQSMLFQVPADLDASAVLRKVIDHHDLLRAKALPDWTLSVPAPGTVEPVFASSEPEAIAALDPVAGRMIVAVASERRLLLVVHHAVVDGVSWRILAEDLENAYHGKPLAPVATSFRTWASGLAAADRSAELPVWQEFTDPLFTRRPLDPAVDTVATARRHTVTLPAALTNPLLTTVPAKFYGAVNDVLLTALAMAFRAWRGGDELVVDLEGHGREEETVPGADLSRTFGWFTTIFPVRLSVADDLATSVMRVKEQLRAIPDNGIGYGLLGLDRPAPQLLFNYLGRFSATEGDFTPAPEAPPLGEDRDPRMPFGHALELDAVVRDSADGPSLSATFTWPSGLLGTSEVEELGRLWLAALEEVSRYDGPGGHTESDFLPVTPLQQGLFFHSMFDESDVDDYVVGQLIELSSDADPVALRQAVQRVVERHEPLRTGFRQLANGVVVQCVSEGVTVPWREVSTDDVMSVVAAERATRMDLSAPPLLRATLINGRFLLLAVHHLVADGWSESVLLREIMGSPTAPVTSYRSYLDWFASRDRVAARSAWADALASAEPTRLAAASVSAPRQETVWVPLPEISARAHGLTFGTLVHGAWGVLLGRLTGRTDVVFGSTVSGREADVPGIESMVGLFVNTLPVRVRWEPGSSFVDVLARLQDEQAGLLDHQHVGLAEVGAGDLFDTLIVVENYPAGPVPGIVSKKTFETGHYPLEITVTPGVGISLEHDAARLPSVLVRSIASQFVRLLTSDLDQPVGRIDLVDVPVLAGESVEVPFSSLHSAFSAQVALAPDAPAVVDSDVRLSYAELERRADSLARALPGGIVAVEVPRSAELIVALLAVWKSGGAYLPIDVDHPAERKVFLLADSGARAVIREGLRVENLPVDNSAQDPEIVGAGWENEDKGTPFGGDPCVSVGLAGDAAAYLMYTSGSTGKPKGVVVPHRAVLSQLTWLRDRFGLGPGERFLHQYSASFDPSVQEIFGPLLSGGTVVIAKPHGHRDPAYLAELITKEQVTTIDLVPSMYSAMLLADLPGGWHRSLKRAFSGGETLTGDLAGRWRAKTNVPLHNVYGPTEAVVQVSSWEYDGEWSRSVPIGTPVGNTQLHVLDSTLRPVAPGMTGELYIAGEQLAHGYHGRAALTAERFVANPFGGGRMYRTGDLVVRDENGVLTYAGRTDHQVKIRGNRVELGEIEAVLAEKATEVVVTACDNRLVAYATGTTEAELRAKAIEALPEAVVPSAFVVLDEFPRTAGGKVDLKALPEPETERAQSRPQSERERQLCAIFTEVLTTSVGPDDDFFALGGDSILSISVSSKARKEGLTISPREVFQHRTPAALAALVPEEKQVAGDPDGIGDVPQLPIVHQLRTDGGSIGRFNLSMLLQIPEDADLEPILQTVIDHHDALRLKLTRVAGVLWSLETRPVGSVQAADLLRRGAGSIEEESDAAVGRLDPDAGVMLQAVWWPGKLFLAAHHLAVDGVSWRILFEDLQAAHEKRPLEPVRTSLRTYARVVNEQAQAQHRLEELTHWVETLQPGAELVPGAPRTGTVGTQSTLDVRLSTQDTQALLGSDVTETLLAALAVAAGKELLVDVERHGREEIAPELDLSRTVGWFTSVQPVRVTGDVRTVKERLRAAPDNGLGYGMLRYLNAQVAPLLATSAQAQVLFNYFGRFSADRKEAWRPASDKTATAWDADLALPYQLQVDAVCEETPDGPTLRATFTWPQTYAGAAEISERWVAALRELAGTSTGLTPSDLTTVSLTQEEIDRVVEQSPVPVEDIWPLSPLQEGLYFHASYGEVDVYTAQDTFDFAHPLDVDRLRTACKTLLRRHPSLRAGFASGPVQFITTAPEMPITEIDLAGLTPQEQDARTGQIKARDRTERFDLASPPLCRISVLRLGDRDRLMFSHHLVLWDGWSQGTLIRELLELYASNGDDGALPQAGTYRDYLAWLAKQDQDAAAQAWGTALGGLDEPTLVAPDRGGEPAISQRHLVELDETATARLRDQARQHGLTLNTVLNAAWAFVLSSAVGRTDVVFGTTVAGRPGEIPNVDTAIGMFLNTVPVRVALDPRESVVDLLRRVQDERAALMSHDYVGLGELQRISGHSKLFDTLYVLQNFADAEGFDELKRRHGITAVGSVDATHYPLTLVITPDRTLRIALDHRPDLVESAEAEKLLARFTLVLDRMLADPHATVGTLDTLSDQENAGLRAQWDASANPMRDVTIAEMLAQQAIRTPDATALVFGTQTLTYAELDARIDALAKFLLDRGAGPEQVVALALPRSAEMVVALFAVLRTGAAYLPLDLDHPAERLLLMIEDTKPLCVLSTSSVGLTPDAICLDQVDLPAAGDVEWPRFSLEHPAYVIYTSGSTGKPKGVVTPYRGLTNMQLNHQEAIFAPAIAAAGGRRLRIAHTVSFAFDMSWEELLWLVEGHEVHVCDEELRRDAEALVRYCDENLIDVVNVTPTYAHLLIEEGLLDGHVPPLVLLGGEAVPDAVWTRLRETEGTFGYNLYGPTEYTINTLGASTEDSVTPTVGRAIWNTRGYVLDPFLRPVPVGVPGELYIAGIGLARGYHDRFGLTAERFVADPFGGPGERMYRTGDLVRAREDGILDFLGRTDDQVKIRGYRVELGEISSALTDHPAVSHAAVIVDAKRLVGYVVSEADPAVLREHLKSRLPDYMVPAAIMPVTHLPLTVNGKLDVRALPKPEIAVSSGREASTEQERVLCGLFAEVLGLPAVGVEDNFFDLGGHSLLATRLVSKARTALGAELAIRDLFEAPTAAELALRAGGSVPRPALVPVERPDELPLSSAQQRLWVIQQMEGTSAAYNFPLVMRLRGEFDLDAFQVALRDVVQRHEALRTLFVTRDGEAFQQIVPARDVPVTVVDSDVIREEIERPFDLDSELPLRVTVVRESAREHVVLMLLHHITTDEWSDRPFLRDLAVAYEARIAGGVPEFEPLPVQYADYALWQDEVLAQVGTQQLDFWERTLDGAPEELDLPVDRPRPVRPTFRGDDLFVTLEPVVAEGLRGLAQQTGASMFMLLHAATAALLHRLGAGDDIPLGAPIAGRTDEKLDELVGFFVNTLVLRTDLSGDPSFLDLVSRVRETDLAAFSHSDVPFEAVVERLNPVRSLARNPLFQVMVGYHSRGADWLELPGLDVSWEDYETRTAKFDLVFSFTEFAETGGLQCRIEYATDLFDRSTVERLGARLNVLLGAVVAAPESSVSRIDVLASDEWDRVVVDFNDTVREVPEETFPQLFAGCVARFPDKVAVTDSARSVTYAQLDVMSNRVAHALAERGIGRGSVVGITVPKSAEMVATVLGVLKAGAAYLPLDLSHPQDRIDYMVEDSGAALVVSELLTSEDESTVDVPIPLDAPAYVIYTSGSTGKPKGVVVPHEGISSLAATAVDRMKLTTDSRVLQFASVGFDVAVFELTMALTMGGTLVFAPDEVRVAGPALTDFLAAKRITHMILPPSLVAALPEDCVLPEGSTILVGTETVPPEVIRRWAGHLNMLGAYGLTEATVNSTLWQAVPEWDSSVPIGVPDPNTVVYVLDSALRPVPPGVVGELYVGGRGLALGYLGKHALTSERFVASPFGPPGSRIYRTGDRARWRADGNLDFLGRVDDQVKIRGFRIELGEIVSALTSFPGIGQAAVVPDRTGDIVRLVGYVVGSCDPAEVRAFVAESLPEYMVPAAVVPLDGPLPLTPNGKLNRRALPKPDWSTLAGDDLPATPAQKSLADLFCEVLGLDRVGVHDNFFSLGGHSMSSMRLVGRMRAAFGVDVSIREVFDSPTVAGLAERLAERLAGASSVRPSLVRLPAPAVPVVAPVRRQFESYSGYQHELTLRFSSLDEAALRQAIADVVERHALSDDVLFTVDGGTLLLRARYVDVDEWSVVPLFRDLNLAYSARCSGHAPAWEPLPVTYADYAQWSVALLAEVGERQKAFWRRTLRSLPPGASSVAPRDYVEFSIDLPLQELARSTGTSLFMVLQAAFASLQPGTDVPVATFVSGRPEPELADLVGCFHNMVVLRVDTAGAPTFRELLARVRETNLAALEHQDVPFSELTVPVPRVMVDYHQAAERSALEGGNGTFGALPVRTSPADLTLSLYEPPGDGPVHCELIYATDLYDRPSVEQMAADLVDLLRRNS